MGVTRSVCHPSAGFSVTTTGLKCHPGACPSKDSRGLPDRHGVTALRASRYLREMPWKASSPMDQRLLFIAEYVKDEESVSELCRRFGISRKTGHKFIRRYKE